MSAVRILLPGMFRELAAGVACPPALRTLLRFARQEAVFDGDDYAWRCAFFGVERQQDFPVAPFAALGDGLPAGGDYWLCADPVHLRLQRDSFTVDGEARQQDLRQAEVLIEALNAHFAGEGMTFFAPQASRWYLRLPQPPHLLTTPLSDVVGQNIHPLLPRGTDALLWHKRLNEIQMLLHGHAVNLDLEQQGRDPVNSVWLWGGGILPDCPRRYDGAVWAHDAFTRGLALAHGGAAAILPSSAEDWLEVDRTGTSHLIVLDQMQRVNLHDLALEWHEELERLDRRWFAPVLQALHTGSIKRLELHLAGTHVVHGYTLTRSALHRFWRRVHPLGFYLGQG